MAQKLDDVLATSENYHPCEQKSHGGPSKAPACIRWLHQHLTAETCTSVVVRTTQVHRARPGAGSGGQHPTELQRLRETQGLCGIYDSVSYVLLLFIKCAASSYP